MPVNTAQGPRTVGVLTALYHAVQPGELELSLQSIVDQTTPPDEWVIVVDGPVSCDLEAVIEHLKTSATQTKVRVLHLPENVGNGVARQAGLDILTSDYVAIQDADDISKPERLEATVRFMDESRLDFAGSALAEFHSDPLDVVRVRQYPPTPAALADAIRLNNPIGHPSFMFDRAAGVCVGGYQDLPGNEDYDLVARLVAGGYRGASSGRPLVNFRMNPSVQARRGGYEIALSEFALSRRLAAYNLVNGVRRWTILGVRLAYRLSPARVRTWAYSSVVTAGTWRFTAAQRAGCPRPPGSG